MSRTNILKAVGIALTSALASNALAGSGDRAEKRAHIDRGHPYSAREVRRATPSQLGCPEIPHPVFALGRGVTLAINDWGPPPNAWPYAYVWSHSGAPCDRACNLPTSPCWDQDRE